jgi:hypothetical protein
MACDYSVKNMPAKVRRTEAARTGEAKHAGLVSWAVGEEGTPGLGVGELAVGLSAGFSVGLSVGGEVSPSQKKVMAYFRLDL